MKYELYAEYFKFNKTPFIKANKYSEVIECDNTMCDCLIINNLILEHITIHELFIF